MDKSKFETNQQPYVDYLVSRWKAGMFGETITNDQGMVQQTSEPINPAALLLGPGGQLASGAIGTAAGALGIGSGASQAAGSIGADNVGAGAMNLLKGRLTSIVLGALVFNWLAGAKGISDTLVGKEINKWASENDIDVGNLRLAAQITLYTTPVIDPSTGQMRFLDNDAERLRKRMAEAGIPKSTIELQLIQLQQQRKANERFVAQFETGQIGEQGKSIEEQALAGETPVETLARLQKEKIAQQKDIKKQQETETARAQQQSAQFQAEAGSLTEQFRQETGLPANAPELKKEAFGGNASAEELLTLLRTQPPDQLSPPSGSQLTPEQLALAQQREAERGVPQSSTANLTPLGEAEKRKIEDALRKKRAGR